MCVRELCPGSLIPIYLLHSTNNPPSRRWAARLLQARTYTLHIRRCAIRVSRAAICIGVCDTTTRDTGNRSVTPCESQIKISCRDQHVAPQLRTVCPETLKRSFIFHLYIIRLRNKRRSKRKLLWLSRLTVEEDKVYIPRCGIGTARE